MRDTYSLYEAKAKLSAIVRRVREGRSVVVTLHGEPVAEIRPLPASSGGLETRLAILVERGVVTRPARRPSRLRPLVRRPGALGRFLSERDV
ncbi:MAG TPA: type II toxin-antitoxin system prevent-host-death family antitoxin [Gemmatimonadaceae bacterium]|nr:type II toxin-antitoxin system prevent-host-death family antitoxin [Gemmatimonadaceae bacterium]